MNIFSRLALLAFVASLAACSVLQDDKVDYKHAATAPALQVPPDLSQLSGENRYGVPGGLAAANSARADTAGALTAVSGIGDVRLERSGTQRWIVVNRTPDQLWSTVRDFWQENGFLLTTDQRKLGIMETDWAENRAKLPQDIIRRTVGKLIDSAYSTGELDRFRTRMERTPNGTEIFISHRGMVEVYSTARKDQTIWQPRPVDPALETEFLRRLMVKLGVSPAQSKELVATAAPAQTARIANVGGQPVLQIGEGFDSAWRRVGLALDRSGFTVEDRDRNAGIYFVQFVTSTPGTTKPGLLAKIFTLGQAGKSEPPAKYRVLVQSQGQATTVSVRNEAGAPEPSAEAQRIVKVIADDLD